MKEKSLKKKIQASANKDKTSHLILTKEMPL